MNKFSLHHVFSSMNLFIKANGKHKEIARSDCSLVSGGSLAIKPPKIAASETNKRPKATTTAIHNDTCSFIGGGTAYKAPRKANSTEVLNTNSANAIKSPKLQNRTHELSAQICTLVGGSVTPYKKPKATASMRALPIDSCTSVFGGTGAYKRPRATAIDVNYDSIPPVDISQG
ncbi:hypothetical protein [Pseudoalteromonas aurantia]|uniref:Uncharacterized protein n=1 Tax=Pseudoalteromonas aurantia TaxID=43654 RepID=A0ABY2VRY5_9GAMM|nr:hypothetical protein [Pseudoalteromonas aurantia]TMO54277.1 hypothetical protein CWC18_20865 [Pseudoalteromonas aurantia]TMO69053.1 hypothetical protein CWC20_21000 [Pseudoalteromonas aurantia]